MLELFSQDRKKTVSKWSTFRWPIAAGWLVFYGSSVCVTGQSLGQDPKLDFFESKIRPVLVERCYECHSADTSDLGGNLRLDYPGGMRQGGVSGAALIPGSVDQSLLVKAIEYTDSATQMPPDGKLPDELIADFKKWVEEGAVDPRPELDAGHGTVAEDYASRVASHWAYQPLTKPEPPQTTTASAAATGNTGAGGSAVGDTEADPIDRWVGAGLQALGISKSAQADRRTLTRRLYYDLVGLPPTLTELQAAMDDASPDWYRTVVDRLLGSPHFGERMARRWMDVVRYADNKGYVFQEDREYPHAYRYRDWLIRSFNEDLPYDQFVRYQLIGDRLDPDNAAGNLDAMGMLTLGRRFLNNPHDIIDDRIDVVTRGLLGVTAACARCHDHKFDPVSAADYYSLHAAFMGSEEPGGDPSPMRLVDKAEQGPTRVFLRGSPGNPGPEVPRRFISLLSPKDPIEMKTGSGRLEMAESIVSPTNPLTARVYVNRIWGWIYGAPLVDNPSDFGVRTSAPEQQAVLDTLAWDLIHEGWSTKQLIRRIVLSRTYRQCSDHRPDAFAKDPENRWLWRAQRKRMDFESLRDGLLLATGKLNLAVGGKSVSIIEPPFANRRTVYAYIDRQNLPQLFRSFDLGSPDAHVPQRSQTTVPQQGLVLLNSDLLLSMLGDIATQASQKTRDEGIDLLFHQILARDCTPSEREWMYEVLDAHEVSLPDVPQNQWSYGTATFDPESGTIDVFERLPRYHAERWQGKGDSLPDADLDWAFLNAAGGHPGTRLDQVAVRRWTAFAPAKVRVRGTLKHPSEDGNGVRASIVVRGHEKQGEWIAQHSDAETQVDEIEVAAGDTIDFVVDSNGNVNGDSFEWRVRIVSKDDDGYRTQSERHFSSEQPTALTAWEQVTQALLLTNEFCFID